MPQRRPPRSPYVRGKRSTPRNIARDVIDTALDTDSQEIIDDPTRLLRRVKQRADSYLPRGGHNISERVDRGDDEYEYRFNTYARDLKRAKKAYSGRSKRRR